MEITFALFYTIEGGGKNLLLEICWSKNSDNLLSIEPKFPFVAFDIFVWGSKESTYLNASFERNIIIFFHVFVVHLSRERAKSMFYHGYNGYLKYGFPYDELRPISCTGHDTWGRYVDKITLKPWSE